MRDNHSWKSWLSLFVENSRGTVTAGSHRPTLGVEHLEDRTVPTVVDLTTVGSMGEINGAIFQQNATQPAGSGVIHAFVRIHAQGAAQTVEQGYNTNARPLQFDENNSPQFTRALQLSAIPLVDIGGVNYREFLLDINQNQASPQLSLDELRLYVGSAPNLTGYDTSTNTLAGLTPVYDMEAGVADGTNWVKLDSSLNPGLGKANMILDVPDSLFSAQSGGFVYLYSKFGVNIGANGGFEQWAVAGHPFENIGGVIAGTVTNAATGAGLAGWTVFIDISGTGVFTPGDISTTTDTNGNFVFTGLATGLGSLTTYTIVVVPPAGWVSSTPNSLVFDLTNPNQDISNANFSFIQTQVGPPTGPA